jgi:all-trans-8'-apo-beta-carotenal 15,15'-oxygenase
MTLELSGAQMRAIVNQANRTVVDEHTEVPLDCQQGRVPPGLNGVLYRNGPGRFERGSQAYGHPFDGDGHILRIAFADGQVRYTNRFVRTGALLDEELAGRLIYRGFGTNLPGGLRTNVLRLKFKNPVNTHIVRYGARLLAMSEGGSPYRLDPQTLETMGLDDFDGRLCNPFVGKEPFMASELPFSAHPCVDRDTGELFNFGILGGSTNRLMLYRVAPDGTMAQPRVHPLERFSFVHSFQLTRRYLVFLLPYADFRIWPVLLGVSTLMGSIRVAAERPMEILLIPRDGGAARTLDGPPGFVFHFADGYDLEDGRVVLNLVRHPSYPPLDRPDTLYAPGSVSGQARLERLIVDPLAGTCGLSPLSPCTVEFPRVAPGSWGGPERFVYSIGAPEGREIPYRTCVLRSDTETGETIGQEFFPDLPGEPVPVPDATGEVAWVLTLVYRAQARCTDLVVLRGQDLSVECVLALPHAVPPGFHGSWVDAR